MFIRAKYVLQFSRRDDLQNTGFDPAIENRRIVWTCIFEDAGSKAEGSISCNYRFHITSKYMKFHIFELRRMI